MEQYHHAAKTSDLKSGEGKVVNISGRDVALFNVDGNFYAIDNTCKHRGGPLGEGILYEDVITCPWHGWNYNVKTGKNVDDESVHVQVYKVKVESDNILISLS